MLPLRSSYGLAFVLFLCVCLAQGSGMIVLQGAGSGNSGAIVNIWAQGYRFIRDDVRVRYSEAGVVDSTTQYSAGLLDYLVTDRGITRNLTTDYSNLIQFPLAGQAMAIGYNLPELNATTDGGTLVLNTTVLADIWGGDITTWNHTAIKELNPDIADKLPSATIFLGYHENANVLSFTEVFKAALESFSPAFKAKFAAANRTFDNLPPKLSGHAERAGGSGVRIGWLQNKPYALTWFNYIEVANVSVTLARMINRGGGLVEPTVASIQSAMTDFQSDYDAGRFTVDIFNGGGVGSWPMSYLTFFALEKNASLGDCTDVQEILNFVAWIHTNKEASAVAEEALVAPLDISLRKKLISVLHDSLCNGQESFTRSILVGTGAQIGLMDTWAAYWSFGSATASYYPFTSATAREQMAAQNVDFGMLNEGLNDGQDLSKRLDADIALMPFAAQPIVPAYNIAGLKGKELVLDAQTIGKIYLGEITMWNDSRIQAINSPEVAALLPGTPIKIVVEGYSSGYQTTFTYWLNATVSGWQVGVGEGVTFPIASMFPDRVYVAQDSDDVITLLTSTASSFSFGSLYDVRQAPTLGVASLVNQAGNVVTPSLEAVTSAIHDFVATNTAISYHSLINGGGSQTWPLASFSSIIYRSTTMTDCSDAEALADFLRWVLLDSNAEQLANRQGYALARESGVLRSQILDQLKAFTCDDNPVSVLATCINDGDLCSSEGTCNNGVCVCNSTRTGAYCERIITDSSSDTTTILLAVIIPTVVAVVLILLILIAVLVYLAKRNGQRHDDWEIKYDELEVSDIIGTGGFGEVSRATWKGTEVAVKVMASDKVTKDMERSFKEEVRVMTALRHPNVVLFMAACTKAPKMCIVMEYMALGSLFDLLHNELIPELPFALKAKMAYQASKGMHFLHSSGIVHRDLKSLNLLLDAKWNVKVSDFGLTKFKEDIGHHKGGARDIGGGSVHWTAPEVLNETVDVDFILADVYSFGIILWELLTRMQPYLGLSPAAVAVAVIRDGMRPTMPEINDGSWPPEYEELITSCWHTDPTIRPTFLEIMTRLSSMHGDSSTQGATSFTSKTSSSSSGGRTAVGLHSSWTLPSGTASSSSAASGSSSSSSGSQKHVATGAAAGVRPPEGEVTIVFTDITRAASLWEFNAMAMRDATLLHNETLRSALHKHRGYEVVFLRDKNSGEGSFCMAFQHTADAMAWCLEVQQNLLNVTWPEALLEHPGAAEEWSDVDDRVLFKGLRVRMGVHVGVPRVGRDPMTRRVEYIGPVVNAAARITALTHGGQIVISHAAYLKVKHAEPELIDASDNLRKRIVGLGKFEMPDAPNGSKLYELRPQGLEGRFFGGVANLGADNGGDQSVSSSDEASNHSGDSGELQTEVGEGMMFKEDTFLTSANLCRWIIDFGEVQLGKQIGLGSYGVVYRGKWKGVDVAVKRFIKQKLDERRMLEFRAEMAFLSELHHPNIVLFIGACVKKPNLCIVTEFMKQGSVKDILSNSTVRLTWQQKMRLLRSTALGINYLHSLSPCIVHRDLKSSNLLVDENWNVKVADFGFARIKEENATMTRCGTPCWTAPEIIRGEKYDERVDVYSFGVIMWEVLTRKQPFAGRNFMGVSLDVLEGKRPQIPGDCPPDFAKLMKKCWHASPDKRPLMEDVLSFLELGIDEDTTTLGGAGGSV